jgi:hypothetical protein
MSRDLAGVPYSEGGPRSRRGLEQLAQRFEVDAEEPRAWLALRWNADVASAFTKNDDAQGQAL